MDKKTLKEVVAILLKERDYYNVLLTNRAEFEIHRDQGLEIVGKVDLLQSLVLEFEKRMEKEEG